MEINPDYNDIIHYRYDQARLDRKLRREISEVNNQIACAFKNDPKLMENPGEYAMLDRVKDKEKTMIQATEAADRVKKPVTKPDDDKDVEGGDTPPAPTDEDKDNLEVKEDDWSMFGG